MAPSNYINSKNPSATLLTSAIDQPILLKSNSMTHSITTIFSFVEKYGRSA